MQVPRFSVVPNEPTNDVIFDAIKRSPLATAALAEAATKNLASRKTLSDRLAKLEVDAEREFPKLRAIAAATFEAVKAAEIHLAQARAKNGTAYAKVSEASFIYAREHDEIERNLIATCEPAIKVFVSEMEAEWERTMRAPLDINVDVTRNQITGDKIVKTTSSAASIRVRMTAIREVINTAQDMRFDPDQSTVLQRLEDLRSNLPPL